jgi:hypothetical protein
MYPWKPPSGLNVLCTYEQYSPMFMQAVHSHVHVSSTPTCLCLLGVGVFQPAVGVCNLHSMQLLHYITPMHLQQQLIQLSLRIVRHGHGRWRACTAAVLWLAQAPAVGHSSFRSFRQSTSCLHSFVQLLCMSAGSLHSVRACGSV